MRDPRPSVLCLSGHDPGGGAGIQADIETVLSLGGHAVSLITAHTVQDSTNVIRVQAADPALLREQATVVLADVKVHAIKIGLLGDAEQIDFVAGLVRQIGAPVVLDPVLRAGGGAPLVSETLIGELRRLLLPLTEVLTPNAAEARRLSAAEDGLDAAGAALLALGVRNVLVTGGDEPGESVVNRWYRRDGSPRSFSWPRLPGPFHGAGCTLASAIATLLARGLPVGAALADAQAYVHASLQRAHAPGRGRRIPGRAP